MKKAIRKITIFSLIILLLSAHIVILGETIANALELHNEDTNIKNVKYDAYIKTEEGNKYEKQANISERETLVLNVKVNNQGVLRDAKINKDNTKKKLQSQPTWAHGGSQRPNLLVKEHAGACPSPVYVYRRCAVFMWVP